MIKHFRIKNNFLLSGLFFLVTLFSVGSSLVSCSDSEKIVTQTEEKIVYVDGNWMVVASKEVTVMTGESVTLNVSVGGEEELKPEYTCTSKDANIATVAVSEDNNSIIITVLADLIAGIKERCPKAKLLWHQTWAYASSSTHESFPDYDSNQMTMYSSIVTAARQAMTNHTDLSLLIPSGTAIQNGRTSFLGDAFNRDGYHLEVTYGRYTAACTWFEMITGQNVVGNPYAPETIDPQVVKIAQNAAHYAVQKPDEVTDLVDFKQPEISDTDLKAPIYIDFGPTSLSATPWNNITSHQESSTTSWIKDVENNYTNIGVRVLDGFTATHAGVGSEPASPVTVDGVEFPLTAWKDGLLVKGEKNQGDVGPGRIEISQLDVARKYNFTILAIRFNGSKDARISSYKLVGKTESAVKEVKTGIKDAASFAAANFEEYIAKFENVEPDSEGKVIVEVKGLDTGSAAEGHINALCISLAK